MKNRYLSLFLSLVLGIFAFTGCEDIAQVQTPIDFAQIRVANFNNTCQDVNQVYDVFIYPVGQPSALPQVRGGLSYGVVTPWIDNLQTNRDGGLTYKVQVRNAGQTANIIDKEITLKPGDRYTLWIFRFDNVNDAPASAEFISDKPTFDVEPTKAYFRFINTEQDVSPLSLRVGDPLSGKAVGLETGNAVTYRKYSDYTGYTSTTVDTTLTFFVVDGSNNVVGRIAGVALESGTFKTITWGGNCPGRYLPQEDPTVERPDSHRVRVLDDAGDGSDETKIVPQTLRYFFVNALIPPASDSLKRIFGYDQLGVVVNNDNRYNFAPLSPYSASPTIGNTGPVINVVPTATLLTDAVNVKGYVYNAASPNVRGPLLFDYRAGPRESMITDQLVAFVVSDTVRKYTPGTKHPIDSTAGQLVIPIPDQPKAGLATFVITNMLANRQPASANKIEFYINDNVVDRGSGNWTRKLSHTMDVPTGPTNLKVKVNADDQEVYTFPEFTAESGGIYLVLVVGRRLPPTPADAPKIMVIRTNPQGL